MPFCIDADVSSRAVTRYMLNGKRKVRSITNKTCPTRVKVLPTHFNSERFALIYLHQGRGKETYKGLVNRLLTTKSTGPVSVRCRHTAGTLSLLSGWMLCTAVDQTARNFHRAESTHLLLPYSSYT